MQNLAARDPLSFWLQISELFGRSHLVMSDGFHTFLFLIHRPELEAFQEHEYCSK
jgi:hypothetical protein